MTTQTPTPRPTIVTENHLIYLDDLRKSGRTNMFGARPFLARQFGLEKRDAAIVLAYWMESFGERHSQDE